MAENEDAESGADAQHARGVRGVREPEQPADAPTSTPGSPVAEAEPDPDGGGSPAAPESPTVVVGGEEPDGGGSLGQVERPAAVATAAEPADTQVAAAETIRLRNLGLRGSRGWAFRDVDLTATAGDLVVLAGPSGSGRSALLLTIAGRLRPTTGTVEVAGETVGAGAHDRRALGRVRQRVAVARIGHHIGLDEDLPVEINARDAADWAARPPAEVQDRLAEWRARSGLRLEPRTPVAELSALEATALHLLLAVALDPDVIVLDDADAGLTAAERDRFWQLAADVAATGPTVVASAGDLPERADVQVALHRHGASHAAAGTELPATTDRDGAER